MGIGDRRRNPELSLREWHEELEQERPLTQREQLERDLDEAVAENFEEAARLRDSIRTLWPARVACLGRTLKSDRTILH